LTEDLIPGELVFYAHVLSSKFKSLELIPISDIHYGNHLHSPKHFKRTIEYIKAEPNRYTFLNGDLCECVTKTSKGDSYKQKISPQEQRDDMIEFLAPIKSRVLGMTTGNHENRIYQETSMDISKDIAKALGVPYRPEGMLVKISFGSGNAYVEDRPFTYWGYFTHGYGGARTNSAKTVKVERTSTYIHSDFYCMSHDHVTNAAVVVYLMPDPRTHEENGFQVGNIRAMRKMLIKTNSAVKWGGYAEIGGFAPSDLSTAIIKLNGDKLPHVNVEI
jgi:hypothetical protein